MNEDIIAQQYDLSGHLEGLIETAHPSIANVLKYFRYTHLPEHLREVSESFASIAVSMIDYRKLQGTEATVGLRKLLEAKDCFVRAALD